MYNLHTCDWGLSEWVTEQVEWCGTLCARRLRGACAGKTVGGEIDSADGDTSQWHSWLGALVLVFELVFVD